MPSVVLLEADVDVLGELSAKLRARGLSVVLADSAETCLGQVEAAVPDAILVSADSTTATELQGLRERIRDTPMYLLVDRASAECSGLELPRGDAETIAKRIHAVPGKVAPSRGGDFRGDLKQVPIADLLQLLSMNRRTGTLSLNTSGGAGEIRLTLGQIADAVYRRLEGEKALFRLLGETDGSFQFVEGTAAPLSRFSLPPQSLLMEGTRQLDELRRRSSELNLGGDALAVVDSSFTDASARPVLAALSSAKTFEELLDEVNLPDLEIARTVSELLAKGVLRTIPRSTLVVELADSEQLGLLAAQLKQLGRPGFQGPPRILIAGNTQQLAAVRHAVGRILHATPPPEASPTAPVPHLLGTLRLGEAGEVSIVGLPALAAYSPLWGLALPGSALAIRLPGVEEEALSVACALVDVPLLDASALLPGLDEFSSLEVASLIRAAVERAAGG